MSQTNGPGNRAIFFSGTAALVFAACGGCNAAMDMPLLRRAVIACLVVLLAACTHALPRNPMARWVPSPNFEQRRPVLIVLHATTQHSVAESLDTLRTRNSGGPVSAHYLIGRDGTLYQLVSDQARAWHAGPGRWGTITDVNSTSIGIELDNDGESPYAPEQIASLLRLLEDLCTRLDIPRTQVIAHADMAPTRKVDPGRWFPWKQLSDAGFGRWPANLDREPPPDFDPMLALRLLGYVTDDPGAALRAFRLHYRALDDATPVASPEDARILYALTQ
jgi:N-acetylmuramoyl-L-alanine amidase